MRILVVEDDRAAALYLVRGLRESGHVADHVDNGATALAMAQEQIYDALILDQLLPQMDGLTVLARLRAAGLRLPVLMLSALGSTHHRVEGLRAGADDYLAKPYAFTEVLARLEGLVRRTGERAVSRLQVADLVLDYPTRTVTRGGVIIALQQREWLILDKLMRHADQVVTRSMLLESAWDYDFDPRDNVIDKHIHRLRQKLDAGHAVTLIHTVPGAGYRLSATPPKA